MFRRLERIRLEFGTFLLIRTLFLITAGVVMAVLGYIFLETIWPAVIVLASLVLGWLLRRTIVNNFEKLAAVVPVALSVYGIVLFLGEKLLGLSTAGQVIVITAVTMIVFEIQFWSLSDPELVNQKRIDD